MADTQHGTETGDGTWHSARQDYQTVYSGFLGVTKWAIILIGLVLIGMAIFLV